MLLPIQLFHIVRSIQLELFSFSLKKEMKNISKTEKCVDILTVAQSYVYFEKLILRNIVNKTNRKICASVCLLLSAKMNDIKGVAIKHLLEVNKAFLVSNSFWVN